MTAAPARPVEQLAEEAQHGLLEDYSPALTVVVPLQHAKTLHLIRHGEGFHNVAGRADHDAYKSWDYEDAHLTELGWTQAHQVQQHIQSVGLPVELVVVSPLTRALETAVGCFGNHSRAPAEGSAAAAAPPLMAPLSAVPERRAAHGAVSGEGVPPFVVHELCREHLGVHPCDRRRDTATLSAMFPGLDFSGLSDQDELWSETHRETKEEIMARGRAFLGWLSQRPETNIAVVSHSSFLHFMLANYANSGSTHVQGELRRWFENCELRSVVLCDPGAPPAPRHPMAFPGFASHVPEGPEA